jgi:hypothetical protein
MSIAAHVARSGGDYGRILKSTPPPCRCAGVNRDAELDAITQFIAANGATRCPAAYVAPTATGLSRAEEARRLKRLRLKKTLSGREYMQMLITRHSAYSGGDRQGPSRMPGSAEARGRVTRLDVLPQTLP